MHHIGNSTRTLLLIISPLESKATTSTWYEETILLSKLTPVCHTPFRNISSMRVRGNMSIEWVHQSHQLPVRVTSHSKCCSSLLWFYPRIAVLRLSRDNPTLSMGQFFSSTCFVILIRPLRHVLSHRYFSP